MSCGMESEEQKHLTGAPPSGLHSYHATLYNSVVTYCAFVFQQLLNHFNQLLLLVWIKTEKKGERTVSYDSSSPSVCAHACVDKRKCTCKASG